jgi:hypothetical protein
MALTMVSHEGEDRSEFAGCVIARLREVAVKNPGATGMGRNDLALRCRNWTVPKRRRVAAYTSATVRLTVIYRNISAILTATRRHGYKFVSCERWIYDLMKRRQNQMCVNLLVRRPPVEAPTDKAPDATVPPNSPEPTGDRRLLGWGEYASPTLTELLRLPPSSPDEADPHDNMDDADDEDLGVSHGLAICVLTGASKWGAVSLMVWLLLDW